MLGNPYNYDYSRDSVTTLNEKGVPLLEEMDATPLAQGLVVYGSSFHTDMRLLHEAGMSKEDILRGATSLTVKHPHLTDRGRIAPGMRADLLLLDGDPLEDISNSDEIVEIWTAGKAVKGLFGRLASSVRAPHEA